MRTQPGSTALEVTPKGPASWATARASPITPCLEAVYALPERSAFSPAVELVNTSAAEAALAHAAHGQPRELERAVEVDAHGFAPDLGILLPHQPLVGRADAVVDDQQVDRPQPSLGLPNGQGAAFGGAEIGHDVLEPNGRQFRRAARDDHHARSRGRQQQRRLAPDSPTPPVTSATRPFIRQAPAGAFVKSSHVRPARAIVPARSRSSLHGDRASTRASVAGIGDSSENVRRRYCAGDSPAFGCEYSTQCQVASGS